MLLSPLESSLLSAEPTLVETHAELLRSGPFLFEDEVEEDWNGSAWNLEPSLCFTEGVHSKEGNDLNNGPDSKEKTHLRHSFPTKDNSTPNRIRFISRIEKTNMYNFTPSDETLI